MSSAVTQVGKLPRKTVKLIRWGVSLTGDLTKVGKNGSRQAIFMLSPNFARDNEFRNFHPRFLLLWIVPLPLRQQNRLKVWRLTDNRDVKEMMVERGGMTTEVEAGAGELSGMASSLLALHNRHAPATAATLAAELEAEAEARRQAHEQAGEHSRAMAAMYREIAALLDELREAMAAGSWGMMTEQVSGELKAGLARLDERLEERLEASEERQREAMQTMMEVLRADRHSSQEEARLEREALSVEAQLEVNRLLRVMWLATGLAAVGAGTALFLLEN
jgi:hypothetical protein